MFRRLESPDFLVSPTEWDKDLINRLHAFLQRVQFQINTQVQDVGADIASAATITPSNAAHHVRGTAAISTIRVPDGFCGPLWLFVDEAWTLAVGGNISKATAPAVNTVLCLYYEPRVAKWYPTHN